MRPRALALPAAAAAVAAGASLALAGCGVGPTVTESRTIPDFDRLVVSGSANVRLRIDPTRTLTVTAGGDILDRVRTDVVNGVLTVDTSGGGIVIGPDPVRRAVVEVTVPYLDGVEVTASGDATVQGVRAVTFTVTVDGSGSLSASGRAARLVAVVDGSGDADLRALRANRARIEADGSGDASLHVEHDLDASVGGSGTVTYRGRPLVQSRVDGAGDIRRLP
jgi:hypothetical protein